MKNILVALLGVSFLTSCQTEEEATPANCFNGLEVIINNPDAEVFTKESENGVGFLVIRINDPQAKDDVVLRYSTEGFTDEREYFLSFGAEITDYSSDQTQPTPPEAYAIYTEIAYDFDLDNPVVSVKAGGDNSNIIVPGYTRGSTNTADSEFVGFGITLTGTEGNISAGSFKVPFTWDGFGLPDPLVTSISFGVSHHLEREFDTKYLEFKVNAINKEGAGTPKRDIQYNFECD